MSCIAVIRPDSPTTYADPFGRCSSRKAAVAAGEDRVVGDQEVLQATRLQRLDELRSAWDRVLLVHQHAVHVGEPGMDRAGLAHPPILPGAGLGPGRWDRRSTGDPVA